MKIFGLLITLLVLVFSGSAQAQSKTPYPSGDGQIRLYNYHLNEFAEITFKSGNQLDPAAMEKMDQLLRSRDGAGTLSIDPRLWDLLDHLQDHFQADTVEIISGYRSKEFNAGLLKDGHKVSPVSLHMQGKAIDIHIDEVKEETLRDYLLGLKLGGVGYYGPLDFVHVDVGAVKTWSDGVGAPRKLVGVLDPKSPVQLTSDKNDYLPQEILNFSWDLGGVDFSQVKDVKLERFWRGKWTVCESELKPDKKEGLPANALLCKSGGNPLPPYGKYRWTFNIPSNASRVSSNEFYLKKD